MSVMKISRNLFAVLLLCWTVPLLKAQPDAGTLLREQQSQKERKPPKPLPDPVEPTASLTPSVTAGPTIVVKEFRFRGYEGLASEQELQKVVKDSIGMSLGVAELQRVAERITAELRVKGHFLARAYLPKQDVTGGVVEIAVIQARSDGGVVFNRAVEVRLRPEKLQKMVDAVIKADQPLREDELERVLLLVNDLPGISARAVLEPGTLPGTTRITANVTEADMLSGAMWVDNSGNRYTGSWRGNGLVSVSDPFRIGDEANVMFSGSDGLLQGRIFYATPIGSRGLRADVSYSDMQYKIVEGAPLFDAKGSAQTVGTGASYPLIRRRTFRLTANAGYEFAALVDKAFSLTIRDKQVHTGTAGVTGDHSDNFAGGGFLTFSAAVSGGYLDLSKVSADEAADKSGPRSAGSFGRFTLAVSRTQHVTDQLTFTASYLGQYASQNLDSSQKFSLGGPNGVRAYPVGEATGDEGHLFNFECRQVVPVGLKKGSVHAIGFLDTGHITLNKTPWAGSVTSATGENSYWLSGVGLGLEVIKPDRYTIRATYAHKLGSNPGRSANGMDADGRDTAGRIWAMVQLTF